MIHEVTQLEELFNKQKLRQLIEIIRPFKDKLVKISTYNGEFLTKRRVKSILLIYWSISYL